MKTINSDALSFVSRVIALLGALVVFSVGLVYYYADVYIIKPVDSLVDQAMLFKKSGMKNWIESDERKQITVIKTNDEIEDLYTALLRNEDDVSMNLKTIEKQTVKMLKMEQNIVNALANVVENRDSNTGEHIIRTSNYVKAIALELQKEGKYSNILTDSFIDELYHAAPLHDLGKICVSDVILNKPGKLTTEEFEIMKQHTVEGAKIIGEALSGITGNNYLTIAKEIALYHHEWFNGTGYMSGLKGDDIPLSARIMAVADVFDALTSKRSYKDAFSIDKAIEIINNESGTHFDPIIIAAFNVISKELIK